jgi:hypothetical protein
VRFAKLVVASVAVCTLCGTTVGAATWLVIVAVVTGEFTHLGELPIGTLRELPIATLLGLMIVGPFGIAAGIIASGTIAVLGKSILRNGRLRSWALAGTTLGGLLGGVGPWVLSWTGWDPFELSNTPSWAVCGLVAGSASGFVLGRIGWRSYGAGAERWRTSSCS